jgi:predicted CXXCH cytochrome family protein
VIGTKIVRRRGLGAALLLGYALYLSTLALVGCVRREPARTTLVSDAVTQTSASCLTCHAEIFAAWRGTDHALASRPVAATDRAAFTGAATIEDGGSRFEMAWQGDHPVMTQARSSVQAVAADFILGAKPLWQPVLPVGHGRWQPTDLAYDPAKTEWFNIFGQENRQPSEWGHWTGRGMNWNSMCAQCHMTGYQKNYDQATDSYRSTWVEHGVGCIQCHGPTALGHGTGKSPAPAVIAKADRQKSLQTCLSCHSRAESLGTDFQPGDNFLDHHRLALPGDGTTFHADGQQRDEVFTGTSFLLSRMGHAGVTCLDCHDAHTTKTILPAANNQLCLQCHAGPGRVMPGGTRAVVIDPVQHSHHAEGSAGNSCVACHMPTTTYMQRAPRHDHGWLKPDPLLTKELGIPNACARCHADKPVEWAIDATSRWYGDKMDSAQRTRARAVAAAQAQAPDAARSVLAALEKEDIPGWRATLLEALTPYLDRTPAIAPVARQSLGAGSPLERSAAVRLLAEDPGSPDRIRGLLRDPVRLVRIDAEFALALSLDAASPERKELAAYLAAAADQPLGRVRLGQDLASRGQLAEAQRQIETAVSWDPLSAPLESALALLLNQRGQELEAAAHFKRAAELDPRNAADAFRAALAYAGAARLVDAESALRLAVAREPGMHRVWYNLGLLLAQTQRLPQAVDALRRAESLDPATTDYAYALATIYLRLNDRPAATEAARRVLSKDPNHAGARAILGLR